MKRLFSPAAAALLVLITLAGCAATNPRFPSLLPRASESRDESEPVRTAAAPVADPALDARLAMLRATLDAAAAAFPPLAIKAKAAVGTAKGDSAGGEAWLTAQTVLGDLDIVRAQSLTTLSEVDQLAIDRGSAGLPAYPAIETLRNGAEAQAKTQGDEIEKLQDQLPND